MSLSLAITNATLVEPDRVAVAPLFAEGGRIVAAPAATPWPLDLGGHLVFPGLINGHDHLQLNAIPPLPAHAPFPNSYQWILAFQPFFNEPAVAHACAVPKPVRLWHGGVKNMLCGATTVAHHDPWQAALDDPHFPVRVVQRYGWSHSLGLGLADTPWRDHLLPYGPPVAESFRATPPDQPWIIHLAEGTDAAAQAECAHLDKLGCLYANTVLVHGVGLSEADIQRVIGAGAAVIWCPASNQRLLGRTLDPRSLIHARRLALGSDSRISGAPDLLDELRAAAATGYLAPRDLLRLVTADAGAVLRLPDGGGLAAGQWADMLIIRATGDPYHTLLETRRADIRAVVRGGVPLIANPDFADWFAACGIDAVPVAVDRRPKLMARTAAHPEALALESGLQHMGT